MTIKKEGQPKGCYSFLVSLFIICYYKSNNLFHCRIKSSAPIIILFEIRVFQYFTFLDREEIIGFLN